MMVTGGPPLRVLVVEEVPAVRALVAQALRSDGVVIEDASDGRGARQRLAEARPDVVVLDVDLRDGSGLDLLRDVFVPAGIPTVMLSDRGQELDGVRGLELGAEDYVVKPFLARELEARTRRAARRAPPSRACLEVGDLVVDRGTRKVQRRGQAVAVTAREFDLLAHLAAAPGQAFTREELLRSVWKSEPGWQSVKTVTEHVRRLRQKLEDDPSHPTSIVTVGRSRYRLDT